MVTDTKIITRQSVPADAPRPLPGETQWFSGLQRPARVGVYRRLTLIGTTPFSYFDGTNWLWNRASPALAAHVHGDDISLVQTSAWAGLAAPPANGSGPTPTAQRTESAVFAGAPC